MGLLKALTIVLILLFPLGELGRINIHNEISATVNDILVFLLLVVWLTWLFLRKKFSETSDRKLGKPILIFVFIALLSLILNFTWLNVAEFIVSFLYLLRFISYASLYFIISEFDMKFKYKIIFLIIISGAIFVLGGFLQYFLYPSLRNLYYLGWDEHLYRLFASFLDPNFAASIISLFIILILSMLFTGLNVGKKTRVGLLLLSVFAFSALLLTYSRSGYLMILVGICALLLLVGRKTYIALLLLIFAIGIILIPKNLGGEGVKLLRTQSLISRSDYLGNAITIFKENPILGVGFNSYRYAQYRYGFIDQGSFRTSHAGAGTDNSFLFVLATTGIIGFISYVFLWFKVLKSSGDSLQEKAQSSFVKTVNYAVIASSIGIFVNAFFINSLFYPFAMEWMWILIGLRESK